MWTRTRSVRGAGRSLRSPGISAMTGVNLVQVNYKGAALALNDVDRFLPSATPGGAATPDPATYLSWNRGFVLYRKPKNFGRLEIPARTAAAPKSSRRCLSRIRSRP